VKVIGTFVTLKGEKHRVCKDDKCKCA